MKKVWNILILGLKSPPSFWDFLEALKFLGFKVALPPLGPITVAAMIPKDGYEVRFVDMRVDDLPDEYIKWADLVLISVIVDQLPFLKKIIARCNNLKKPVVVGGPCTTSCSDIVEDMGATSVVIGEAEDIMLQLLKDWEKGELKKRYQSSGYPNLTKSPIPDYSLLKRGVCPQGALQTARGCFHKCDFCETANLNGTVPRFKTPQQIVNELDNLLKWGFDGKPIFVVDDNFITIPKKTEELLIAMIDWQKERGYPFSFFTQTTVKLAGMPHLMRLMVEAGFTTVFVGVESLSQEALEKAGKRQNMGIDLVETIKTINSAGLVVNIGIIFGLDNEPPSTFDDVLKFAKDANIPIVMAGLLVVPKGTPLHKRLESEGRLLPDVPISSNTNLTALNYIPQISEDVLIKEYKRVLQELYEPTLNSYFERCWGLFKQLKMVRRRGRAKISWLRVIRAVYCSLRYQFFSRKQGPAYRKFLWRVLCYCPKRISQAVVVAAMGYHLAHHTDLIVNS